MNIKHSVFWWFILPTIVFLTIGCDFIGDNDGRIDGETTPTTVIFESMVAIDGADGTANTTGLSLSFSVDPTTLTTEHITVAGATKGELIGTGTTRTLSISNITVANGEAVSVVIETPNGYSLSGSPKLAVVYLEKVYFLRDAGPAGGLVFYDKGSYSNGWRYLEAAPNNWNGGTADPTITWQNPRVSIGSSAQGIEIGTGKANTVAIVNWLNTNGQGGRAAQVVNSLIIGGFGDWFLPSKAELNQMYLNLHSYGVGGFVMGSYWSSSEDDIDNAWNQSFSDGTQYSNGKNLGHRVRAIRAF
jgi:hypothetical protein